MSVAVEEPIVRQHNDTLAFDDAYVKDKIDKFGTSPRIFGRLFEANTDEFGREVLTPVAANCVVAGGAIFTLMKLFNVQPNWLPQSINQIYNINADVEGNVMNSQVALFGVGIGGCGLEFNSVIDADPKQREVAEMIPIRVAAEETLTGTDAEKYYMKTQLPGTEQYAWLMKEFDQPVGIRSLWKDAAEEGEDGTEITGEIYDSPRTEGQEHFAEMILKFNKNDVRSYWEAIGDLSMARFNSIGIYFGEKVITDPTNGAIDYINVRLFSTINFENDSVKDRKEIKYVYRLYAMI